MSAASCQLYSPSLPSYRYPATQAGGSGREGELRGNSLFFYALFRVVARVHFFFFSLSLLHIHTFLYLPIASSLLICVAFVTYKLDIDSYSSEYW